MRASFLLCLIACNAPAETPPDPRVQVALVPVSANRDVDLLFVLDNGTALDKLTSLKDAFPAFVAALGPLPNVHIGVVTMDLGTSAAYDSEPGPPIGSGPGSCAGDGQGGSLQTNGTTLVADRYIVDVDDGAGGRIRNYQSSLSDAFAALAAVGASGCGFEQPFEAAKRALEDTTLNAGFVRPDAELALVIVGDEDDCSAAHTKLMSTDTSVLGPLQSFRCTHFGVACDEDMAGTGVKHNCHWSEDATYLTERARYDTFFDTIKADPRDLLVTAIAGPPEPVEVELRPAPGSTTAVPGLAHSCDFTGATGLEVADPAVRISELIGERPRGVFESVCNSNLTAAETSIARHVRNLVGDACLARDITLPADCRIFDQTLANERELPPCGGTVTADCHRLVEDPACIAGQHLRIEVTRSAPPPPGTMVAVRCVVH